MNPSSSSNADSPREATFKVGTRQLSADLAEVGPTCNPRDLGTIPARQFAELLAKFASLPPEKLLDDDPHLIVSARRGRFIVRPARGQIRLFDADNPMRAHLELSAAETPAYLDGAELNAPAPAELAADSTALPETKTRAGLVLFLFLASVAMVSGSAYVTFRTDSIDPDSEYTTLPPERAASLRQQLPGVYATKGGIPRTLTIRAEGTLTLIETGPDNTVADKRDDVYQLTQHSDGVAVARAAHLGAVEVRDTKTVFYAGESYARQP